MDSIEGKVALVTGASRGIGRDAALALAAAGCRVAVGCARDRDGANQVVAAIQERGGQAVSIAKDLADPQAAAELVHEAETALGPLDIVVNAAGINPARTPEQVTVQDWEQVIRVNLGSAFHVIQAALPGLRARRWGRLITLSSIAAQLGGVIGPHYAASKAGLIGLTHYYAAALAKEGITANAIAPALIETEMLKGNAAIKPTLIPIGRFGQTDEVVSVILMLAANGYITGQTINVNGGWYMS
jgi:3-oxoacyl-[acyl-carrier protein] reductase